LKAPGVNRPMRGSSRRRWREASAERKKNGRYALDIHRL